MDLSQIPLFEVLTKRMAWLSDRQTVLAENVANADVPGFVAHDLKPPDFQKLLSESTSQVALATTEPGHIQVKPTLASLETNETEGSEKKPPVEEEMMKVSQTANDYALASTLYRANFNLVMTVIGRTS
jgi:flagellar basal-body rod protein FlgB